MASSIDVRALSVARYGSVGLRHAALVKAIERWIARIRAERRIRRGIEELMTLDDRTLSDIGLARGRSVIARRQARAGSPWNACWAATADGPVAAAAGLAAMACLVSPAP